MTPELTPAEIDALIEKLRGLDRDDACLKGTQMVPLHRDTLREIAAALADCREKLAQMAEVEGRADQVCRINDEMHTALAALRADAERLDWVLSALSARIEGDYLHRYKELVFGGSVYRLPDGSITTIRAAIDAARAEKP